MMKDLRQTPQFAKYIKLLGWNIVKLDKSYVFIKRLPLIGSVIKLQRPENLDNKAIKRLGAIGKKYRAFQISIEPLTTNHQSLIIAQGYKLSKSPSLCTKTVHVDLSKTNNLLLSEMHHKTRYNIKVATKRGIKINASKDIEIFAQFWQKCALKQRHMFLPMRREIRSIYASFAKDAYILFATKDSALVAAILLICSKDTAHYMYAASTRKGKKLFAPTLITWKSIKLAKTLGCKTYDFEGIYDERFPLPTWKGFSRFKKSFGGTEVEYPGVFVKYRFPF